MLEYLQWWKNQEGQGAGAVSQMQKSGWSQREQHLVGPHQLYSTFSILVILTFKIRYCHSAVKRGGFSPSGATLHSRMFILAEVRFMKQGEGGHLRSCAIEKEREGGGEREGEGGREILTNSF